MTHTFLNAVLLVTVAISFGFFGIFMADVIMSIKIDIKCNIGNGGDINI